MAKTLDGLALANQIKSEIAAEVTKLAKTPGLGTILVGNDPASKTYVAGKHKDCAAVGISSIQIELAESASETEILKAVSDLNQNDACTGFIVQLPLPNGVNTQRVLEAVDPRKDADGLHPINLGRLLLNQSGIKPCTPLAIIELVEANGISWDGKEVVIIGRGTTVGRPLNLLLGTKQLNSTVTVVHTATKNIEEVIKRGDIVVAAIGVPHFLKREMVKPGAVVIDVGLTRTESGLQGDVSPEVADIASAISPVPGGVGPMTRAMLLRNLLELAKS
jgi:methylenetetrahydrofolate dehydrogenase (NADP+)/methenyltetrahydrofolate cyclohydrolase